MNRLLEAWKRLSLGTGLLLHGAGDALSPGGCGPLLVRGGGALLVLFFVGRLLERAPHLVVLVPVVWAVGAWQVSGSSAPPPPPSPEGVGDVYADGEPVLDRAEYGPEGVRYTLHVVRGEVNGS